jgi:hypothetical protein
MTWNAHSAGSDLAITVSLGQHMAAELHSRKGTAKMSRRGDNGIHLVQLLGLSFDGKTCYKMRKGRGGE